LVENAVKHGVARSRAPVEIRIRAAMEGGTLCIEVANCLVAADADEPETNGGVGLANVRHRLEAVFGTRASLVAGERDGRFVAAIRIPDPDRAN